MTVFRRLGPARERPPRALERVLEQVGLPRLLRLAVAGAVPPTWLEIAVLHFRGSFQSRPMWVPVTVLPVVFVGGALSTLTRDDRRSRALFRPLAWAMTAIGAVGTLFHFRGIRRQMGGFSNWTYNSTTGPPWPAPVQVALFGLVGALASSPPSRGERERLVLAARLVDSGAYLLLLLEAGASHWMGGFYNRVMWVPVVLSPVLGAAHVGAIARIGGARRVEGAASAVATFAGLVGFGFHVRNIIRRTGGISWQNYFYGAPVVAPLQLAGQGVLGLLASVFDDRR